MFLDLPKSAVHNLTKDNVASLAASERLLLLAVISSVGLDTLANLANPNPYVAPLKGLILIIVICSFRSLYSYLMTFAFLGIFFLRELNITFGQYDLFLVADATFFLRILFFVAWLLLFYERRESAAFLRYVLYISIATTILCVLCQFAGMIFHIGFFAAYEGRGRSGYKGLFFAENDTGVFYLASLIYSMALWRREGRWLYSGVVLVGLILLGLGSKTALFGTFLVPVVYFGCVHHFRSPLNLSKLEVRPRLATAWATGIVVTGVIGYFGVKYVTEILGSINYDQLIRVYQESGLLSSLLSFRDQKVLAYFQSIRTIPDLLFGLQLRFNPQGFLYDDPGYFMYEIDLFDYLARVGLIGSVLTLLLISRSALARNWRSCSPEWRALIVTIALLGCTVGHTLISSINGMWIAFWIIALGKLPLGQNSRGPSLDTSPPILSKMLS
ncbi:MAG TPA: hypothetical protein VGN01_12380 [Acidobacteriaceae bacterium]|jgi:hypothetical protein